MRSTWGWRLWFWNKSDPRVVSLYEAVVASVLIGKKERKNRKKKTKKNPALDDDPFSPPQQKDKEFYLPEVASDSAYGPEVPLMGT